MKFSSQIDAMKIAIKGFLPESSSSAPSAPVEGQGWHDTGASRWKVFLGSAWRSLVDDRRTITAGTGLAGGGDLTTDRTLSADFSADGASTAGKVVQANDSRLANSRPPSGAASGDLTGSYPNPSIANGVVTDAKVAAGNKDGTAATPSMRTLGTGSLQAMPGDKRLDTIQAPLADVNVGGFKLVNVGAPTVDADAANKKYVDERVNGADWKESVYLASTGNVSLPPGGTTFSMDGVGPIANPADNGRRILLKNQTDSTQNGIYILGGVGSSVTLTRAPDADQAGDLSPNASVFVENGGTQADTGWTLSSGGTGPGGSVVIGTDGQAWTKFTGVGELNAGAGLTKAGNTVDVVAADGSIVVNADSVTVGLVPLNKGGTGATTVNGALAALNGATANVFTLGALTAGTWATIMAANAAVFVEAGLVAFRESSNGETIMLDWRFSGGALQVRSDVAWASGAIIAIINTRRLSE